MEMKKKWAEEAEEGQKSKSQGAIQRVTTILSVTIFDSLGCASSFSRKVVLQRQVIFSSKDTCSSLAQKKNLKSSTTRILLPNNLVC